MRVNVTRPNTPKHNRDGLALGQCAQRRGHEDRGDNGSPTHFAAIGSTTNLCLASEAGAIVTSAPHVARLAAENVDDAIEVLRARGLRLSATRQSVLDALFAASGPLSAEQIALKLGLVAPSVYRNLEMLERHGLVHHVHLGHGPGLYALAVRGPREYIYCPECGVAKTVRPELLDPVRSHIKRRFGYQVSFAHFALVGTCQACVERRMPERTAQDRAVEGSYRHGSDGLGWRGDSVPRRSGTPA